MGFEFFWKENLYFLSLFFIYFLIFASALKLIKEWERESKRHGKVKTGARKFMFCFHYGSWV